MASITLDKTDPKILQVLQESGCLTSVELSEQVTLSPSPCLRRLKQPEDAGIIRKYAVLPPPAAVEPGLQASIRVSINKAKIAREEFSVVAQAWSEVSSCSALTGRTDYLLHTFFTNMNALSYSVLDTSLSYEGVQDARSSFVSKKVKNTTTLPLAHLQRD